MSNKYIIMDTDIGMISGKIVGYEDDEDVYILSVNGKLYLAPKEYVYEDDKYPGALFVQGHDIGW